MSTKISDIIQPSIFNPYVINRTSQLSALYSSGIVQTVPELQLGVGKGNRTINMPFFKDITGNSQLLSDSAALTVKKIGTDQDVAVQNFRGDAWGANDLAGALSGADPMKAIGDLVAAYWARDMQTTLVSFLTGLLTAAGAPLGTSHLNTIALETTAGQTAANMISAGAIVNTISKLGDAHEALTGIIMHSVPYFNLVTQNLIVYVKSSDGSVDIPTYLGKRVIVDDQMPKIAGTTSGFKYLTVLFGQGAIGFAEGTPEVATETARDGLAGEDILINRKHFVLHPRGVKWTGTTIAGITPTNAEIATANNWSKVYEDKQIRLVGLLTNG